MTANRFRKSSSWENTASGSPCRSSAASFLLAALSAKYQRAQTTHDAQTATTARTTASSITGRWGEKYDAVSEAESADGRRRYPRQSREPFQHRRRHKQPRHTSLAPSREFRPTIQAAGLLSMGLELRAVEERRLFLESVWVWPCAESGTKSTGGQE